MLSYVEHEKSFITSGQVCGLSDFKYLIGKSGCDVLTMRLIFACTFHRCVISKTGLELLPTFPISLLPISVHIKKKRL